MCLLTLRSFYNDRVMIGVLCSMRQRTVLLKDKTPPSDIRNIYVWQYLLGKKIVVIVCPIHFDTLVDKMDFSAAINKLLFKLNIKI